MGPEDGGQAQMSPAMEMGVQRVCRCVHDSDVDHFPIVDRRQDDS